MPPAATIVSPVMYPASSDTKNATVAPISCVFPKRFKGTVLKICSFAALSEVNYKQYDFDKHISIKY